MKRKTSGGSSLVGRAEGEEDSEGEKEKKVGAKECRAGGRKAEVGAAGMCAPGAPNAKADSVQLH